MHNVPSPRPTTDESIEEILKGTTAPRIKPDDLEAEILAAQYYVFPGTTLTVCCLTLQNGFTVVGESACASPELFNKELGEKIARENAKQKLWPLLGFRLKDKLFAAAAMEPPVWP